MFALSLVDFLSLLLSPSTYFNIFYFCQKYHLNYTYKIFKKFHVVSGELLMQTCWWPLSDHWSVQAHLTSLVWVCVLWLPWKLNGAICGMPECTDISECPWVPPISQCMLHHAYIWLWHELIHLIHYEAEICKRSGRWQIVHCRKSMHGFVSRMHGNAFVMSKWCRCHQIDKNYKCKYV